MYILYAQWVNDENEMINSEFSFLYKYNESGTYMHTIQLHCVFLAPLLTSHHPTPTVRRVNKYYYLCLATLILYC